MSISSLKTNIANVRNIIFFLEILEDYKDLTLQEWNFREILKQKLSDLLDQQKIYWKRRGAVRWVKFGGTNTKFFHANASIRHRGNLIKELVSDQGVTLQSHKDKELIIWNEFKERLSTSTFSSSSVDPTFFIQPVDGLDFLENLSNTKRLIMLSRICQMISPLVLMASIMKFLKPPGQLSNRTFTVSMILFSMGTYVLGALTSLSTLLFLRLRAQPLWQTLDQFLCSILQSRC